MGTWIGTRVYTPALFVVFAFGAAMMQKGGYDWWGVFWIDFALVGWAIAASSGSASSAPSSGASTRPRRSTGPTRPRSPARAAALLVFRFDTALLILIVIDMVAKPSF